MKFNVFATWQSNQGLYMYEDFISNSVGLVERDFVLTWFWFSDINFNTES